MNLIKIGDKVINLDQVTDVNLGGGSDSNVVRVIAVNGGTDFKGNYADALRFFFTEQSTDVVKLYQQYLDSQESHRMRLEWERDFNRFADKMEVSSLGGERDSFKSFLYSDGDMLEPNEDHYGEWQNWYSEFKERVRINRF